jgi:hypothetical protein
MNNQQRHQFLSAYYFTLLFLHVSATVCHLQGPRLYLLSYMPIWVSVDKILCSMWLCVYYVAAWCDTHRAATYYTHNHMLHRILSTKTQIGT